MKSLMGILWLLLCTGSQAADYYPSRSQWLEKAPAEVGMDGQSLQRAVDFALANEYSGSRDLRVAILEGFKAEPFHQLLGPVKKRGGPAGMIVKDGFIVAQWGDLERVDMTFSVTKSYLSSVAGLAVDQGLIADVDDKVADYVWDGTFDGEHNSRVSWHMLLNQSSDWSGELFGIRDWADRPPKEGGLDDWKHRRLNAPGTVMEYNDVRVNLLAYSLLQVFRQPLPQVLKQQIMDPIGASVTWRWQGYEHAWVSLDGLNMQSVTGGGHSGGGMFVSTLDQARFGLMVLREGRWRDRQILSKDWLHRAIQPSQPNPSYGYMWWLNQGSKKWSQVEDESLFYAAGFGGNFIVIDRTQDLMILTRWLEPSQIGEMVSLVKDSL
ncbi:serine hydrolase domain-containing protein [Bowmanella dokdonensis]|uniref:Serine hydrolase n=1 Tax=Bowmanella dokdonensis TaxID=751969 RepID=A0A939DQC6_9ALTE|nr:serine hydrolase [Bowmanella dokdonensis]MBN7826733.1 serine hydrolase [Bowmanella dokdonensis]